MYPETEARVPDGMETTEMDRERADRMPRAAALFEAGDAKADAGHAAYPA